MNKCLNCGVKTEDVATECSSCGSEQFVYPEPRLLSPPKEERAISRTKKK